MKREDLKLYLVTDRGLSLGRSLETIVEEGVKGGVSMVQLREKDCTSREFYELGMRLKKILQTTGVPLIINDRLDIALAVDADGLHLGQSDLPWDVARRLLGPDKILGRSVENMQQVREANEYDVDYIGISPVFGTATKTDTFEPFGITGTREACEITRHPAVAIGGINIQTTAEIMACGVDGVALVSAISSAENPEKAARELIHEIEKG